MNVLLLIGLRSISVILLVYFNYPLCIGIGSLLSGFLVIVTFFILKPSRHIKFFDTSPLKRHNPLRGKPKNPALTPVLINKYNQLITDLVTYNAESVDSLKTFDEVKLKTECTFAKKAKLWGSCEWNDSMSLEENVYHIVPTFCKFTVVCTQLGLDGFVIQLPNDYSEDIETFSNSVRTVLMTVSKLDPRGLDCMRDTRVDRKGWVFRFHNQTFFITTFAPCYPKTNSRYNFGSPYGYILFQPEISFAQHDIVSDTPHTNWHQPKTVRDTIRIGYRNAGRGYKIRETLAFPMVYDIVKPLTDSIDYIEWWKAKTD